MMNKKCFTCISDATDVWENRIKCSHQPYLWADYMRVENDRMCDGLRCKDAVGRLTTSSTAAKECPKCSSGSITDNDSERIVLCVDAYGKGLRANANSFEYDSCVNKSAFSAVIDERSVEPNNSIGDDDEHFNVIKCDSSTSNSFVINGYDNVNALSGTCKYRRENEVKLKHISFDCPIASKKEYAFKSCPSLDSSLASKSCPSKQNNVCDVDVFSSNSSFLDPCYQSETQSSLPPATPSTPASGVVSQASLDSGVLSAHSFDFSQNFGLEVLDKRRRTASSVSSGIGEMWQTSLDGETSKETAVEGSHTSRSGSTSATTSLNVDGNNCFNSFVNSVVDDDNKNRRRTQGSVNDVKLINSLTSAHCQGDRSYGFPETLSSSDDVPLSVIFPVASPENSFSMATNVEKVDLISCQSNQSTNIKCEMEVIKKCSNYKEREFCSADLSNSKTLKEIEKFSLNLVMLVLNEAIAQSISLGWSIKCSGQCSQELCREDFKKKCSSRDKKDKDGDKIIFSTLGISSCSSSLCWTPELPFSPSHRTYSRTSKRSSLSFSHDSLVGCPPCQDDSHLIKGAVSHDVLTFSTKKKSDEKKDSCTICLEDDIYSLPIDMVKPYDGTILHPKVINQQPKKRLTTRCAKIRNGEIELGNMSKKIHNNNNIKEQSSKHKQKNKHNGTVSFENSTSKRNGQHASADSLLLDSVEKTNASKELDQEKTLERSRIRQRKEVKCADQSKLCRIIPFTSGKSRSKNDICDTKLDKKKSRSLSSNIRNTLITFFSFKKSPKEQGNFINAKNEFIEASSQDLDSSEGIKWGKICPLPSAPPLVTSVKYSAFSERVGSVRTSATTKPNCAKKCTVAPSESNSSHNISNSNQTRQSNSISHASLLSCLGHPRTNSIDDQEHRSKSRKYSDMVRTPSVPTVPKRALPPLPPPLGTIAGGHEHKEGFGLDCKPHTHNKLDEGCDFASIIEKVKNYGWYWGPISGEAAEKVLSNEPDGSFIVRDSSDYHYIFSLTFRLNGVTRHVRIEHDQGNFSFGGFTRFKSQTIVDFIEKAVEHSRSGRYLFFLHRRPVLGPMRVQLLHPVSRFKHVQSLQHLCRFIIVKQVRKDLIHDLPLPQRLKDYLSSPHYYSEQVEQCMSSSVLSLEGATASADSHRSQSPCLQHSSHLRFNSNNNNSTNDDDTSGVLQSANVRQFPNRISLQEPLDAVHFRTLRCSFNDPGTSYDAALKYSKSKDFRLSSSHSSLENSFLQMYPASPSPISSGSNSGRPNNHFCSKFSLKKKGAPTIWSSHSSPSSPVPFDYSPDWLSSSDDFPVQANSTKVLSLALNVNSSNMKANEISSKFSRDKKKTSLEGYCGQSASSTSQSVMDAFLIYENRKPNATLKTLSPASTTQSSENYNDDGGQCTMCETVSQPHSSA